MIKPIRWFILNKTKFESSVFAGVLQLLYDHCLENLEYKFQFENELKKIYPTNYFIVDYIIEDLFNIEKVKYILTDSKIPYVLISDEQEIIYKGIWNAFHPRYQQIHNNEFDMNYIMLKLKETDKCRNGLIADYFYNRLHQTPSNNIIISDLLLELVNREFYSDFKLMENQGDIYRNIKIDTEQIVAQTNSLIPRPLDLPPNVGQYQPKTYSAENKTWVRLAHYEIISETNDKANDSKITQKKYYGGIIFPNDSSVNLFPYARNIPFVQIFTGFYNQYQLEEAIVFTDISEQSQLEAKRILWLNPSIVAMLNLKVCEFSQGIFATNEDGDVVLRFNCWNSNYYTWERYRSMDHEIPQYLGAELVIEEYYFEKICDIYKINPLYMVLTNNNLSH